MTEFTTWKGIHTFNVKVPGLCLRHNMAEPAFAAVYSAEHQFRADELGLI
jgi:hypothetical protein